MAQQPLHASVDGLSQVGNGSILHGFQRRRKDEFSWFAIVGAILFWRYPSPIQLQRQSAFAAGHSASLAQVCYFFLLCVDVLLLLLQMQRHAR